MGTTKVGPPPRAWRCGRALLRKAWRQQHGDLRTLFFDRLDDEHLRSLAEIWARLDPDRDEEPVEDAS